MLLGAIVGYERERAGKAAGLRTHLLVAMDSALFVIGCSGAAMSWEGVFRVIEGVATGIGFIGAGTILERRDKREIEGLTTAAGIYMTAGTGVAVGLGRLGLALLSVILTWVVLGLMGFITVRLNKNPAASGTDVER